MRDRDASGEGGDTTQDHADKIRLGHAIRPSDPTMVDEKTAVDQVLDILLGNKPLNARTPGEAAAVMGAEAALGYDRRPIYAYVGDLHPQLGKVGLVVSRTWSERSRMGHSICDSGGLFGGFGGFAAINASERQTQLQALSFSASLSEVSWQAAFRSEVNTYYRGKARGYVDGETPSLPANDPRHPCIVHAQGTNSLDRRLWTWELHLNDGPLISDIEAVVMTEQAFQRCQGCLREIPSSVQLIYNSRSGPGGLGDPFADPQARKALSGGG